MQTSRQMIRKEPTKPNNDCIIFVKYENRRIYRRAGFVQGARVEPGHIDLDHVIDMALSGVPVRIVCHKTLTDITMQVLEAGAIELAKRMYGGIEEMIEAYRANQSVEESNETEDNGVRLKGYGVGGMPVGFRKGVLR